MAKKEKPADPEPEVDSEAWMDTMADLVFLMITFFVLLISMSSMDSKAVKKAFGFFDDAADVLNFAPNTSGALSFIDAMSPLAEFNLVKQDPKAKGKVEDKRKLAMDFLNGIANGLIDGNTADEMFRTLKPLANGLGGEVKVIRRSDGVEVVISGRILFKAGSTELDKDAKVLLEDVATILKLWGAEVRVVAMWSWHDGPKVLASIVTVLEKKRLSGKLMKPELFPSNEREIRFVLRQGVQDGGRS